MAACGAKEGPRDACYRAVLERIRKRSSRSSPDDRSVPEVIPTVVATVATTSGDAATAAHCQGSAAILESPENEGVQATPAQIGPAESGREDRQPIAGIGATSDEQTQGVLGMVYEPSASPCDGPMAGGIPLDCVCDVTFAECADAEEALAMRDRTAWSCQDEADALHEGMVRDLAAKSLKLFVKDLKSPGRKASRSRAAPAGSAGASGRRPSRQPPDGRQRDHAAGDGKTGDAKRPSKRRTSSLASGPLPPPPQPAVGASHATPVSQVPPALRWASRCALQIWAGDRTHGPLAYARPRVPGPNSWGRSSCVANGDGGNTTKTPIAEATKSTNVRPSIGSKGEEEEEEEEGWTTGAFCAAVEEALYARWRRDGSAYLMHVARIGHALASQGPRAIMARYDEPAGLVAADDAELDAGTPQAVERERAAAAAAACRALMARGIFDDVARENWEYMHKCGKCKSADLSARQSQTRSADEGMSWFCECRNCGNKWWIR